MASYTRNVDIPGKSAQEIYAKISADIDRFVEKYTGNMGKFDIERDEASKTVTLKSSMATAKLVCEEGTVRLDAKLGLIASAFKSKIDQGIDRWLEKTFPKA